MATMSLVSKPQARSTGKKASSAPPPKKKEVVNGEVLYLYTGELTSEQDDMIATLTTMTMPQYIHLST
eukprot:12905871-Prorocentrum_lima.AAC.1